MAARLHHCFRVFVCSLMDKSSLLELFDQLRVSVSAQGSSLLGKSGKIILLFSSLGKVREFEKNASNQGKVREF